jgi:hypothetical protein
MAAGCVVEKGADQETMERRPKKKPFAFKKRVPLDVSRQ